MKKDKLYFYLGIVLLIAFLAQDIFHLKWTWLEEQQRSKIYKQVSGLVLLIYLIAQWSLSVLRGRGQMRAAKKNYTLHKRLGTLAPLFFYQHATQLGHAYLFLLSSVYFTNVIVGFCHQEILNIRRKWFSSGWLVTHVTLSVLVVVLMVYHIFISFYYQ